MPKLKLDVDRTYFPREGPLITIKRILDDGILREKGYVFEGRSQGGINDKYYNEFGKSNLNDKSKHPDDLIKEIRSEEEIVNSLWNVPGQSMEQLLKGVRSREEKLFIQGPMMAKLISSNRISVLRYTSYAPSMRTTFFYFATEHGRLEIINNKPLDFAGFQIGHIHDPMGLFDAKMEKALEER